jgi:hypothetical protein
LARWRLFPGHWFSLDQTSASVLYIGDAVFHEIHNQQYRSHNKGNLGEGVVT